MNSKENMETHCREVKEIFESQPPWIIRWGILVITILLLSGGIITWIIWY